MPHCRSPCQRCGGAYGGQVPCLEVPGTLTGGCGHKLHVLCFSVCESVCVYARFSTELCVDLWSLCYLSAHLSTQVSAKMSPFLRTQCVGDSRMIDMSCADPPSLHLQSERHLCTQNANAHPCMPSCIKRSHTLPLSCRMCLAMPRRASACSAQQAMANPICCSVMPPTTCREFWVATPLGWAPLIPLCCKPSSVRVRVMTCAYLPVCKNVFMWNC